ncbi:MAG: hypothetical protein Q8O26_16965 [Phreatobacter sp.]|uniref:hypothetical protein n=1 Tax=Phreatobacter sp. TaxID=1966341 RepID=UPI002737237B|nr:hypothetical protein [Phreatobacter sp.]MDP2803563.1 hypothetical protein [Phreatobacter sp.]
MTATSRTPAPAWRIAFARPRLWLAALLLAAASLAGGSGDVSRTAAQAGGAVLQRVAFDLAVLRQSEAPSVQRRMATDDRTDGSGGPDLADAAATAPAISAGRSVGVAAAGAAVPASSRRLLPEARAPPV